MRVASGVKVFNTPVTPLGNLVCAKANKKAGIKLPTKPTQISLRMWWRCTVLKRCVKKGSSTKPAEAIRIAASWSGLKPSKPFLIKINELPQIRASNNNNNHAFSGGASFCSVNVLVILCTLIKPVGENLLYLRQAELIE